ncbi:MAG TPA: glycosyltransferase family 4 protein, partial [Gemmatimonadales bacterium]|nr:glycosyltransferase family 4 protein [Gemmatimonadales bacterium]
KEARSLLEAGHEVTLLFTCDPAGRYTRLDGHEVAVGRGPRFETAHAGCRVLGVVRRAGLANKWRMLRELTDLAVHAGADVYHAHEPDLSLAAAVRAARRVRRRGGRALVAHDLHEYPPSEIWTDRPPWLRRIGQAAAVGRDVWLARGVDHLFAANTLVAGYGFAITTDRPIDVLYNAPAMRLFPQRPPLAWSGPPEPLVLCHEGSLGFERGLRDMIEAVDRLRDRVRLLIVGEVFGPEREWLDAELRRRGLEGVVRRTGWLGYADVGRALHDAHVGLLLFHASDTSLRAGCPNKLFNYMNAGLAIVSVNLPEPRRILRAEGCGVILPEEGTEALVTAIEGLLAAPDRVRCMGLAGQQAVRERYSWEAQERVLVGAYEEMGERLRRARGAAGGAAS